MGLGLGLLVGLGLFVGLGLGLLVTGGEGGSWVCVGGLGLCVGAGPTGGLGLCVGAGPTGGLGLCVGCGPTGLGEGGPVGGGDGGPGTRTTAGGEGGPASYSSSSATTASMVSRGCEFLGRHCYKINHKY